MGYRKITNLYKSDAAQAILGLTDCYALEKIHGTSAHIRWDTKDRGNALPKGLKLFPGGIKPEAFEAMIDERFGVERLKSEFEKNLTSTVTSITFYGEAYGGKCQKMSAVYGPLNFVVFEVQINDEWMDVPVADAWARAFKLPFVFWQKGPATLEWINSQRDLPSQQAFRNGLGTDKIGEGVVIRTTNEKERDIRGNRIIAKHKRAEFRETKTVREPNPEQQKLWAEAQVVADEFVVPMRLQHVLDKLVATKPGFEFSMKNTRTVIGAMIGDVRKEEGDTIEWNSSVQRAIGAKAARMWKEHLQKRLETTNASE